MPPERNDETGQHRDLVVTHLVHKLREGRRVIDRLGLEKLRPAATLSSMRRSSVC
jgi:hypothetical protein